MKNRKIRNFLILLENFDFCLKIANFGAKLQNSEIVMKVQNSDKK
jgi:hypothetical protein